jgi:hypothetical protein
MCTTLKMQIELELPLPPPDYEAWLERKNQPESPPDRTDDIGLVDDVILTF